MPWFSIQGPTEPCWKFVASGETTVFATVLKKPVSAVAFALIVFLGAAVASIYVFNIVKWGNYPDFGYGFRTATGINVAVVVTWI